MVMAKLPWTPWRDVVQVRDDLKSGELSLSTFAADLYDVVMERKQSVYRDPSEFFALTYPTTNLRDLAKDVLERLAGKNDKTLRQLTLTYGGGKTHTMITLYHLVSDPERLPNVPAVQEFKSHTKMAVFPKARVVVLPFDKLDVEKGMEMRDPAGNVRWLKQPWSVLAYQIAGDEGLRLLHPDGLAEERDSAPAENLMTNLLAIPAEQGLATLILIDEVLMYAREKVGTNPEWQSRLVNFFQYLTQAASKADRCAVVASLLASDPSKNDTLGRQIAAEISNIFQREQEQVVQPVLKEDVAEILRRRFFTSHSVGDREAFRPHVIAAIQGMVDLDEQTARNKKNVEANFLNSYPFHPDLTDIFYTKWTNLENFQRTRGVLRVFALALRAAESWDESPLISADVFLSAPGEEAISEAARELTTIAAIEEYEGKRQEWSGILESELGKAREIQDESGGLKFREIEQAVLATFLHSQPIGQKATTRDLLLLVGPTRPDKIELEKSLRRWTEVSWFLDEASLGDAELQTSGTSQLPKAWRLGSKPNLKQMHHDACLTRVTGELVEQKLIEEINRLKSLTAGASAAGARVHTLPARPADIEDDGEFHYAVLGPKAASESGKPSVESRRFIDVKSITDQPRVRRNAVVLAAPQKDGLDAARAAIRDYLGWEEVAFQLKDQEVDPLRLESLRIHRDASGKQIPEAIRQAYCVVVTVSDKNEVQAFKIVVGKEPLFNTIKADDRARIKDTAVSAEALLPGGPYDLWRDDETARWVKDIAGAFAESARLPKMLNRKAILDTIVAGCRDGALVLRLTRPDRSIRTFWRETPDDTALKDPSLEAVLPEAATLTSIEPALLAPNSLPNLWDGDQITMQRINDYFSGSHVVTISRDGYDENVAVPCAETDGIEQTIRAAVREGKLWLILGQASIYKEDIPDGLLTGAATLQVPPQTISAMEIVPQTLPDAWADETATAWTIADVLSARVGKPLPWATVRDAIDGAIRARYLETVNGMALPSDATGAQAVTLRVPQAQPKPEQKPINQVNETLAPFDVTKPGKLVAHAELRPMQLAELGEESGAILTAADGLDVTFRVTIELNGPSQVSSDVVARINEVLQLISADLQLS